MKFFRICASDFLSGAAARQTFGGKRMVGKCDGKGTRLKRRKQEDRGIRKLGEGIVLI
jgi:hypothetical protein